MRVRTYHAFSQKPSFVDLNVSVFDEGSGIQNGITFGL